MENMAAVIEYMYPDTIPLIDWEVRDNGNGSFIKMWNIDRLGQPPTLEEIQAKEPEYLAYKDMQGKKEQRQSQYKSVEEEMNILFKILAYLKSNGLDIGPDGDAWLVYRKDIDDSIPLPDTSVIENPLDDIEVNP